MLRNPFSYRFPFVWVLKRVKCWLRVMKKGITSHWIPAHTSVSQPSCSEFAESAVLAAAIDLKTSSDWGISYSRNLSPVPTNRGTRCLETRSPCLRPWGILGEAKVTGWAKDTQETQVLPIRSTVWKLAAVWGVSTREKPAGKKNDMVGS